MGKASFAFIQEAFEKYQLKFFNKGYVRHQNLQVLNTYNAHEHLSRSETAKRLHTSEGWVDQLLETGKIDGNKIESGNKHMILIKKKSVDRLIARYKNALSMDAMKKVLRLKRKTIIQLINSDLLSSERGPSIDGYPRWMFTSRDLEGLFSRIEKHIRPGAVQPDRSNLKTFSEARQMASAYQISSLEFYRLVVSGQLRPWARLPMLHIDSFLFEKSMVEKCVRDQREICLREGYTVKQFAELVGVSLDAAYKLEKEEVVKAQPSGQPKLGKIISKEAAEQFHSTHITSTAIAKQCGVSSNTVIKYLTRANKKPVFGPTVDGGPRYIYLRKDLADYDLSRIRASRRAKKYRRPVQLLLFDDVA
jgi:AraC-like DNA-binding protein